eukprot:5219754-Prymnesium_polylepis.1
MPCVCVNADNANAQRGTGRTRTGTDHGARIAPRLSWHACLHNCTNEGHAVSFAHSTLALRAAKSAVYAAANRRQ